MISDRRCYLSRSYTVDFPRLSNLADVGLPSVISWEWPRDEKKVFRFEQLEESSLEFEKVKADSLAVSPLGRNALRIGTHEIEFLGITTIMDVVVNPIDGSLWRLSRRRIRTVTERNKDDNSATLFPWKYEFINSDSTAFCRCVDVFLPFVERLSQFRDTTDSEQHQQKGWKQLEVDLRHIDSAIFVVETSYWGSMIADAIEPF